MPNEKFEGRPAAVIGFGNIGREVAAILSARRTPVGVHDRDLVTLIAARERGFATYRDRQSLFEQHRPILVVGCGGRDSVAGDDFGSVRSDCFFATGTSRDYEFDLDGLAKRATQPTPLGAVGTESTRERGQRVTVLANGFPINFHHPESMPKRYSDLVLAGMFLGACALAERGGGFQPGHNAARTNACLNGSELLDWYYSAYDD